MSKHLKGISLGSMVLVAIGGIIWGVWKIRDHHYVSTDDCRVEASIVSVGAKWSDRVMDVFFDEGDIVKKGQILAVLDQRSIEARKTAAAARVALTKAQYDETMKGYRSHDIEAQRAKTVQASASLERTKRDYERITSLMEKNAGISQADYDSSRATYLAAQSELKAESEILALKLEGYREEEKRSAKSQWEEAIAKESELSVLAEDCIIKSPVDGMIAQKLIKKGELVNVGQKLFSIVDEHDMWLNVRVEETKIDRISIGQDVKFSLDGYNKKTFHGKVYQIGATTCSIFSLISTENVSGYFTKVMQRIPIKIRLPEVDSGIVFRPGMQGQVEIQQ